MPKLVFAQYDLPGIQLGSKLSSTYADSMCGLYFEIKFQID